MALNLMDDVGSQEVTGSQRAGTWALLNALLVARSEPGDVLCVAAEHRRSKPASEAELVNGHAAAAFRVGTEGVVAEFLDGHSVTADFVDHFRATGEECDYAWETRWVRDEWVMPRIAHLVVA